MRISDWSSDVCSSDLLEKRRAPLYEPLDSGRELKMKILAGNSNRPLAQAIADYLDLPLTDAAVRRFADEEVFVEIHENRSEARSVGKECVGTCRSRWSRYH